MKIWLTIASLFLQTLFGTPSHAEDYALKSYAQWLQLCTNQETPLAHGAPCATGDMRSGSPKMRPRPGGRERGYVNVAPTNAEMLVTLSGVALTRETSKIVRQIQEDGETRTDLILKDGLACTLMSANPNMGSSPLESERPLRSFYYLFKEEPPTSDSFTTQKIVFRKQSALLFAHRTLRGIYIRGENSAIWSACDGIRDTTQRRLAQQFFDSIVMSTRNYF